ncbi:MAG: pentapeptide repeat-containing protein, partial [Acidobacteriaceae bacterium]
MWEWAAYLLSNWSFLEVLDYLGTFSILVAVIFYFSESGDRNKQRHYQAWQVINTAQGKGGSGGRIEALQELNVDRVPLTGVDASSAFLQGVRLAHANLMRSNFSSADLRDSDLRFADLSWADLHYANLRNSSLEHSLFDHADLRDCDLTGADLADARFDGADLTNADLRSADLRGATWQHIAAIVRANIADVRNAPEGFVAWALHNGAVQTPSEP